jgi:outer membrane beta-barrel protein
MKTTLTLVAALALITVASVTRAETEVPKDPSEVVDPRLDRRDVTIPRIDTEDFEIGVYGGLLSVEDFGSSSVFGARLVYHVSEDFFVEGVFGKSTVSDEALCNLGLCVLPTREEDLKYYAVSVGVNFFPGEVFLGKSRAMTSAVYVLAGAGNTSFVDEDRFSLNFGIGIRMLPADWLALHVTVRDFLFESDVLGTNKMTHNFELTAGLSVYF